MPSVTAFPRAILTWVSPKNTPLPLPQASLQEGMLATAIAEAAELSREEGRTVDIEGL